MPEFARLLGERPVLVLTCSCFGGAVCNFEMIIVFFRLKDIAEGDGYHKTGIAHLVFFDCDTANVLK